jgi:hypothetical protein
VSGYDCITAILADTPISYSGKPTYYNPSIAMYTKYQQEDTAVSIVRGKHIHGVLDKKSVGAGAAGGIFHIIANDYGRDAALKVMFNMQQVGQAYVTKIGLTLGPRDLDIGHSGRLAIDRIRAETAQLSNITTQQMISGNIISPPDLTTQQHYENLQKSNMFVHDRCMEEIYKTLDFSNNSLFKMIQYGAKGRADQLCGMMAIVGQRLVNDKRFQPNFSPYRSLVYFRRHEESPQSRGFVDSAYWVGLSVISYITDAWYTRLDMIRKSALVAVAGNQSRNTVYNLGMTLVSNLLWVVTDTLVLSLAYGGDFIDPRAIEMCKFPTVFGGTSSITHPDFPTFNKQVEKDRTDYLSVYMNIEKFKQKEFMTDIKPVPVNIDRVLKDTCKKFSSELKPGKMDKKAVEYILLSIDNFGYNLLHPRYKENKLPIPFNISNAVRLLQMLMRSHLHPKAIESLGITIVIARVLIAKITDIYLKALISPGTCIGISAALAFTQPITQIMLSPNKTAASGGSSVNINTKIKETLGVKNPSDKPIKQMQVSVGIIGDKNQANSIALRSETLVLSKFVTSYQIFFERFASPVHPKYTHEKKLCDTFMKANKLNPEPSNLINWCIRMVIDKAEIIMKSVTVEMIVNKLRDQHSVYVIYSDENADDIVLRIYMRSNQFSKNVDTNSIVKFTTDVLMNTPIRGVKNVANAKASNSASHELVVTDKDVTVTKTQNSFIVSMSAVPNTIINLADIVQMEGVDPTTIISDVVMVMYEYLGIEAARCVLIKELAAIVDSINHRHYMIYADVMTSSGIPTSCMTAGGMNARKENLLQRAGFGRPLSVFADAAIANATIPINNVVPSLMVGAVPNVGTGYSKVIVNTGVAKAKIEEVNNIIDLLV